MQSRVTGIPKDTTSETGWYVCMYVCRWVYVRDCAAYNDKCHIYTYIHVYIYVYIIYVYICVYKYIYVCRWLWWFTSLQHLRSY